MSRLTAAHVSASRIDQAARPEPKPAPGGTDFIARDAILNGAYQHHPTAEAAARAEAAAMAEARCLIRLLVGRHACFDDACRLPGAAETWGEVADRHQVAHGWHGCTGPGCVLPGHADAMAYARDWLEYAGFVPYEAGRANYQWGRPPAAEAT